MTTAVKIQFSLRDLIWVVTGISVWLALIRYLGPMGIIFSSPLLGGWFLMVGTIFRLRSLTILGALIFFAGPLVLGIVFAFLDPTR